MPPQDGLTFCEPMLAKLLPKLPEGTQWQYEVKWDGYRIQAVPSFAQGWGLSDEQTFCADLVLANWTRWSTKLKGERELEHSLTAGIMSNNTWLPGKFFSALSAVICLAVLIGDPSPATARGQGQTLGQAPRPSAASAPGPTAEEREVDKQNLLVIYAALKTYEKEHGKLPDWLSDLVPKYLQDTNVLVSPFFRRTGTEVLYGNEDPHVTTSYIYEFSAKPVPKVILSAFPHLAAGTTMREWKTKQIGEFGPVVPILRCFLHNPVLSVTSDGEFFESGGYWETDPKTLELRKKRLATGSKTESKRNDP